jgi:hypothetical protein
MGRRGMHTGVGGKTEGKRPVGRPKHRWEDNITMDLEEIIWGVMDWIHLAQDRDQWQALMSMVMNLWVSKKCWEILEQLSDWQLLKGTQLNGVSYLEY